METTLMTMSSCILSYAIFRQASNITIHTSNIPSPLSLSLSLSLSLFLFFQQLVASVVVSGRATGASRGVYVVKDVALMVSVISALTDHLDRKSSQVSIRMYSTDCHIINFTFF